MKIAVYSGSFNPLHIGHQAIMEYLSADPRFDLVYLVVSPESPFKAGVRQMSGRERYEAALRAVERHNLTKVKVDDIELGLPAPHYTIHTLDALREREPQNEFTLVIGADNLVDFDKWLDYDRILLEYGVISYPRPGYDERALRQRLMDENPSYRLEIIDVYTADVSSSAIRQELGAGEDVFDCLM